MKKTDIITSLCFILSVTAAVIPSSSSTYACSTPVFRYALERWSADNYEAIVFHRGALSLDEQKIVDKLKKASSDNDFHTNVIVDTVNLSLSPSETMRKLWETQNTSELPWMVVKYPRFSRVLENVWSGPFTIDAVETLLDSPVRKKIARRILDGESAVWVLLESGVKQQDDAAANILKTQLNKMEETLEILVPEEEVIFDMASTQSNSDLRVKFSMIRLSRDDPSERLFVQMLLHTELDLKSFSKPMAFPIFGRGRALYALVGAGINESNIREACAFLVGWCSCEVKALNPGVDLLMSVNWDELVMYGEAALITGYSESAITTGTTTTEKGSSALKRNILIVALVQILIVVTVTCLVLWKRKQRNQA